MDFSVCMFAGSHTLPINPCQLASRQALEASPKWVSWGWDGIDRASCPKRVRSCWSFQAVTILGPGGKG